MFSERLHKKLQGLAKRAFEDVTGQEFVCKELENFYQEYDAAVQELSEAKQRELDNQIDAYLRGEYNVPKAADRTLN